MCANKIKTIQLIVNVDYNLWSFAVDYVLMGLGTEILSEVDVVILSVSSLNTCFFLFLPLIFQWLCFFLQGFEFFFKRMIILFSNLYIGKILTKEMGTEWIGFLILLWRRLGLIMLCSKLTLSSQMWRSGDGGGVKVQVQWLIITSKQTQVVVIGRWLKAFTQSGADQVHLSS